MDFSLTEEQQLLKDSVDRFVRENYEFESRREFANSNDGYGEDNWKQMAELGWLSVALPEEFGGIGGGGTETMVIMEGFGRGLVLEPFFATVVLGANLIMQGGSDAQKEELLPKLAEGGLKLAFAYAERQARFDLHDVETKAEKSTQAMQFLQSIHPYDVPKILSLRPDLVQAEYLNWVLQETHT